MSTGCSKGEMSTGWTKEARGRVRWVSHSVAISGSIVLPHSPYLFKSTRKSPASCPFPRNFSLGNALYTAVRPCGQARGNEPGGRGRGCEALRVGAAAEEA